MSVLIIGANGNMGSRYKAIFNMLGIPHLGVDIGTSIEEADHLIDSAERYLIATPTRTHTDWIRRLSTQRKPILCEKPICTKLDELDDILIDMHNHRVPFRMMYQYSMLGIPETSAASAYDYFKHGNDGLYWDCLQIIALAKGSVTLAEKSPIWRCQINGKELNIGDMDWAYVNYLKLWNDKPDQDWLEVFDAHAKVEELIGRVD